MWENLVIANPAKAGSALSSLIRRPYLQSLIKTVHGVAREFQIEKYHYIMGEIVQHYRPGLTELEVVGVDNMFGQIHLSNIFVSKLIGGFEKASTFYNLLGLLHCHL